LTTTGISSRTTHGTSKDHTGQFHKIVQITTPLHGKQINNNNEQLTNAINDEIIFSGDEDLLNLITDEEGAEVVQQPLERNCFEISVQCDDDDDCCDKLICNKRDSICYEEPRQSKGRLNDGGSVGGSASSIRSSSQVDSEVINIEQEGWDRRRLRRRRLLKGTLVGSDKNVKVIEIV